MQLLVEQFGAPRLLQKETASDTGQCFAIASTAIDGSGIARDSAGSMVMIQSDADVRVRVAQSSATTITNAAGSNPGVLVEAKKYLLFYLRAADTHLDFITESGSANVTVFLVFS